MAYDLNAALHVLQKGGERVTSEYGQRTIYIGGAWRSGFHSGIDLVSGHGATDDIVAAADGRVTAARDGIEGYSESYASGNYVHLEHGAGVSTEYKHMRQGSLCVKAGDRVQKGQTLGHMGTTGYSTGNHLHFGVRVAGTAADPKPYLTGERTLAPFGEPGMPADSTALWLSETPLYAASTAKKAAACLTGWYYLWGPSVIAGRYRITNSAANVGRAGQVTGWVDAVHVNGARQAPRQEAPRQEAPRQEAPRQEAPRQEAQAGESGAQADELFVLRGAVERIKKIVQECGEQKGEQA